MMKNKKKRRIIVWSSIVGFLALCIAAFFTYTAFYYHLDESQAAALEDNLLVDVEENKEYISFTPTIATNNVIIFYPGAKVEAKAYAPLAKKLSSVGNKVYIVKFFVNLAFFGQNSASKIVKEVKKDNPNAVFYLAGHSLGGAVGSMYLDKHNSDFKGIIYLASYTTKDLSDTNLKGLSIYGSEDKVLNMDNYVKYKDKLPKNTTEVVIPGGNHAYFGSYGEQKGDGDATISSEAQLTATVAAIEAFLVL